MQMESTNFIGIVLAAFLVAILLILLAFTYSILTKSKMETQKALVKAENASRAKTDFLFKQMMKWLSIFREKGFYLPKIMI